MKKILFLIIFLSASIFQLSGQKYEEGDYDGDGYKEKYVWQHTGPGEDDGKWHLIWKDGPPVDDTDNDPNPGDGPHDNDDWWDDFGPEPPDGNDDWTDEEWDDWIDDWNDDVDWFDWFDTWWADFYDGDPDDDFWDDDYDWDDYIDYWTDWYNEDDPYADGSGSSSEAKCPQLKSRTVHLPNRDRHTIGIGEEVEVKIKNKCGGTVNWVLTGQVNLLGSDQNSVMFEAKLEPGTIIVEAVMSGICRDCASLSQRYFIEFDVIAPTGIYFDNIALNTDYLVPQSTWHRKNRVSGGYYSDTYLMPDNVNFYKVEIHEEAAPFYIVPGNQYWTTHVPHKANSYVSCKPTVHSGKGTLINGPDQIRIPGDCRYGTDPALPGIIQWHIPNIYKDTNGNPVYFCTTIQEGNNVGGTSNSTFIVSKEQSSRSTKVTDADKLWPSAPDNLPTCH